MRLGMLGGTFNPPHHGHLRLALAAWEQLCLTRVSLMVAADPPHKSGPEIIAARHRLAMVRLLCAQHPALHADDTEIRRGGRSYTVDTLLQLRQRGAQEIFLIVGADILPELHTWKQYRDIFSLCTVIVARRGDDNTIPEEFRALVGQLPFPCVDHSSREIRTQLACGRSVAGCVPTEILHYIAAHRLYRR